MTVPNNSNQYLPGTIQIPSALTIIAISQSYPMIVTVSVDPLNQDDTYISGQLVRMNIPYSYGMQQAAGNTYQILDVSGLTLSLDVNSTNFDPFILQSTGTIPASLSPSGSKNLSYSNNTTQIAFQCLNNIGN